MFEIIPTQLLSLLATAGLVIGFLFPVARLKWPLWARLVLRIGIFVALPLLVPPIFGLPGEPSGGNETGHDVWIRVLRAAWWLLGARIAIEIGRLVLVRTIDRRELVNAMAWVSIPAMIGPLMGPPLGGFITTYASWHWIFLINVPIGLIGIVLVTRYIENIKAEVPERFDFPGMLLSGTAVAGLTFGLSVAGFEIVPWPVVLLIIGIGLVALGFYLAYARRAPAPILDFTLLKLPSFRASLVGGFYYLRVVYYLYMKPETRQPEGLLIDVWGRTAAVVAALGTLALGIWPTGLLQWLIAATAAK